MQLFGMFCINTDTEVCQNLHKFQVTFLVLTSYTQQSRYLKEMQMIFMFSNKSDRPWPTTMQPSRSNGKPEAVTAVY
jgi:predicted transcriptional regulator YheO